ncbi:hypothetical protein QBC46DRAFT_444773 [Diplogelasinospora grovesii]|uniref:Uncharacterized protein n=1 Tax=Diplogelasinospora grovesii TaxID=303347 RepID=A0AAN6NI42_9PEZI|nr:hypothetical protein QBC46DRAFT_444773 [Diplogelasinospora grovesii]
MCLFGGSNEKKSDGPGASSTSAEAGTEQYRSVFLLVHPSPKFKAHWGLFIPESGDSVRKGRMIDVNGNVREGFKMRFRRNYNMDVTQRKPYPPIEIGRVSTDHLADTRGDGVYRKDTEPKDAIEEIIASVPAPGPSLNSVSGGSATQANSHVQLLTSLVCKAPSGPRPRVELSDCQWWTLRCVEKLEERGYLIPPTGGDHKGMNPVDIVKGAPKH